MAVTRVPGTPDPLAAVRHTMDELRATRLIASISTGGNPDWQTSAAGARWVATGGTSTVARIDETTNAVVAAVEVHSPCLSLAAGAGSVWSPSCDDNAVDRIDPATNTVIASIAVPGLPPSGEGQLVFAFGSVWLFTNTPGVLIRIDPARNAIAGTYQVGGEPVALVATDTALWATDPNANTVLEISPTGTVLKSIAVGPSPRFIAAGEGGVWALTQGDGAVTRIDLGTGEVVATIQLEVPGQGGCIATGGGSVWVTMPGTPVSEIDATTNVVTAQFKGTGGDCIGYAAGSVWLSNNSFGQVWRIRP